MSDYVTLEQLKESLSLSTNQTFADNDLTLAITAASRAIDEITGRRFYPDTVDVDRKFLPLNAGYCVIDDLNSFTSLTAQGDTWEQDVDFYFDPTNAQADGRPWTSIRAITKIFLYTLADISPGYIGFDGRITVTGKWGWASTPEQIQEATSILAARLARRVREAPFAVVGSDIDGTAIRLAKFDPDVAALVDPFTKAVIV